MNAPHFHQRANLLWLWILPAAFAWLLIATLRPAFWPAMVIGGGCCLVGGAGLGWRRFPTVRQRFWGGVCFTGSSLALVFSLAFLGCFVPPYQPPPMTPAQIEARNRQQEVFRQQQDRLNRERLARDLVPRDPRADASLLDLTRLYSRLLPGQGGPTNAFTHYLSPGIYTWQGVTFDVRGMVQAGSYGRGVTNHIPVGRKCAELDFLQATQEVWPVNSTNGLYVIHFANGTNLCVPILYGKDVAWSFRPTGLDGNYNAPGNSGRPGARTGGPPANLVIWGERTGRTLSAPQPMYGFYIKRWTNPFPHETVDAIDFEPGPANPAPNLGALLVAITMKPVPEEKP
jgi:hypothetical protein